MSLPRLTIVAPADGDAAYAGMDRPPVGGAPGVPDELVQRAIALEAGPPEQDLAALDDVMAALAESGNGGYDLLWLGDGAPAGWELLGHDVGETGPTAWSAIARWQTFQSPEAFAPWRARLNGHGLFDDRETAEAYLRHYLDSDDPDRGWTSDGWTESTDLYATVPVWRRATR